MQRAVHTAGYRHGYAGSRDLTVVSSTPSTGMVLAAPFGACSWVTARPVQAGAGR